MKITKRTSACLVALLIVNIILLGFGVLMLSEAWYFSQEKAFHMDEMARNAENVQEQQLWMIGAAGARGIAAMYSAIAAASFALASLMVSWTALIISLRKE